MNQNDIVTCESMEELKSKLGEICQFSFYEDFLRDVSQIVARFDDPDGGVYYRLAATQEDYDRQAFENESASVVCICSSIEELTSKPGQIVMDVVSFEEYAEIQDLIVASYMDEIGQMCYRLKEEYDEAYMVFSQEDEVVPF